MQTKSLKDTFSLFFFFLKACRRFLKLNTRIVSQNDLIFIFTENTAGYAFHKYCNYRVWSRKLFIEVLTN